MSVPGWEWRSPPGWPQPPPGWVPPAGWRPSPEWPQPPADWVYWAPAGRAPPPVRIEEPSRRGLVLETWFVQIAFLVPGVLAAVDVLAAHVGGAGDITRFPTLVSGHPVANLILGIISYLEVGRGGAARPAAAEPDRPEPGASGADQAAWARDVWPGLGLGGRRLRRGRC